MIQFDCVTLFPQMFAAVAEHGITRRAREEGRWSLATWNPRDFTTDNHRTVDDRPYGGGPGMVMMAEPLEQAIRAAQARVPGRAGARDPALAAGRGARPRESGRARAAGAAGAGVRPVRSGRRAADRPGDRRRAVDRRLRALGRRARGDGADRRDRAAAAGRVGRRAVGGAGVVRCGAPRLSALHAARGVRRRAGARGAALGAPRGDRALAAESRRSAGRGSAGPTCWRGGC